MRTKSNSRTSFHFLLKSEEVMERTNQQDTLHVEVHLQGEMICSGKSSIKVYNHSVFQFPLLFNRGILRTLSSLFDQYFTHIPIFF
jgi:hypothetical protein